ncbi:MAG: glycosyltransferase family 2 protein [Myxococcota bacterium]
MTLETSPEAGRRKPRKKRRDAAAPRVSIGLPVYNGERYIVESIDSLLGQSFQDFELIICDNGSTDRTEEICRGYEARDRRVRYHRNPTNLGVFGNHAKSFSLATGEFFFWAADDDIRAPTFIEKCVAVLDAEPDVVICYTAIQVIDESGAAIEATERRVDCENPDPVARFRSLIRMDYRLEPVMGLFRTSALRATGAHGLYPDSDRVLLAEMGLRGPFRRLPEILFYRRDHADRSIRSHPSRHERQLWMNTQQKTRLAFPFHRQLFEYLRSIAKVPLRSDQRRACHRIMLDWAWRHRRSLWTDYDWSLRVMLGPLVRRLRPG